MLYHCIENVSITHYYDNCFAGVFYNSTGRLSCFNNTKEYVECADPTGCGSGPAAQAWEYQVCLKLSSLVMT